MEEYYQEDREYLMVLELPENIKDQLGSGSLITLEVDTREKTGWLEEVSWLPNFTLHATDKTWTDAESTCQKEGGHIASVMSEEVNKVVKKVAPSKNVWLGCHSFVKKQAS